VRLQEHAIAQTPLQRRAGLADIEVAVGKAGGASVRHLEADVAGELWERLRIGTDERSRLHPRTPG
jgi:membrane protein YdbS with pleckstrin-like domain